MNRYDDEDNFVRAAPRWEPVNGRRRAELSPVIGEMLAGEDIHVGQPLAAHHGAVESTSGMDRALALVVKSAPFTVVWLVLTIGIVMVTPMGGWWGFIVFSGLTAITWGRMLKTDYEFSRNGLERHKVDTLAELKAREQDHKHEQVMTVLNGQIEMWRGVSYADESSAIAVNHRTIAGRVASSPAGYLTGGPTDEAGRD